MVSDNKIISVLQLLLLPLVSCMVYSSGIIRSQRLCTASQVLWVSSASAMTCGLVVQGDVGPLKQKKRLFVELFLMTELCREWAAHSSSGM